MTKDKIKIRRWKREDIPALVECHAAIYDSYNKDELFDRRKFEFQFNNFPEGQYLAEVDGRIVGYCCSIIVQLEDDVDNYTYSEMTGSGSFSTHNPSGDTLYGADIGIHPEFRGMKIAAKLYDARKKLLRRYNLRRMVAHGRIPGYREHAGKLTAQEYVEKVIKGELKDPALNMHLRAGYKVKKVLLNFVYDQESMNYATWLEMLNPDFHESRRRISGSRIKKPVRRIRVCAAQFEMKRLKDWDEFVDDIEFFVDTATIYHSHFLVLPELFTAQLFSTFDPSLDDRQAMRKLASLTPDFIEVMKHKAVDHGIYIIGGSTPVEREGELYNVAHLFTPSGNVYTQDKLHITPAEREWWDIEPGDAIHIFDTPLCRMAIVVCYDIEFPELARLLTLAGVEVIFVPFSTDERKAYNRVRYCAQARAVENYIYVVISGNVGNLPNVKSYLINYAQSAVLTPSDFAFPSNCIEGEADPNTETVVIAELDLNTLHLQRDLGSVRPLYDRREDLYGLVAREKIKVINVE